ncbi:MAG: hypothetical protein IT320_21525 [Anaerolineae bacterium]|nr:hypothetical protein [Anaerolineae bacterium]
MARRRKLNGIIGVLILIAVVAAGGIALAATGNLENPLRVLTTSSGGGEGFQDRDREGFTPPAQQDGTATTVAERGGGAEGRGGSSDSIQWSQIGSVLYDVWVILAVTAVVVLVGTPIGRTIKWLRQRGAPVPAT